MISESTIKAVKDADIYEVVKKFVTLKKTGPNWTGLCPFHDERSPSFTVNASKGIYKCFGCGASGDAVSFIMSYEKKTFPQAVETVANIENIPFRIKKKETVQQIKEYKIPPQEIGTLSQTAIDYFKNHRAISEGTLKYLQITDCQEWMPKAQSVTNAIRFNYFTDDVLTNVKYRAKNKDFKLYKEAKVTLYNINAAKDTDVLIIQEGEIDTASVIECGIYNTVSVPNGAPPPNSEIKLEYMQNSMTYLRHIKKFVLFLDNDFVGQKLRAALCNFLGPEKCVTVRYHGFKDANDMLKTKGSIFLADVCFDTVPVPMPPKYPFTIRRFMLNYITSQTLRPIFKYYGLGTIKGKTAYKIQVGTKLLAFLMWVIFPDYTWGIDHGDEIFTEEKCMSLIPDDGILEDVNGQRVWISKKEGYPLDMC